MSDDSLEMAWAKQQREEADEVMSVTVVQTTGYVILEIGWEYNDENYYRPECEGGLPRKFFTDRGRAAIECEQMNKEYWAEPSNGSHGITHKFEVVEVEIDG